MSINVNLKKRGEISIFLVGILLLFTLYACSEDSPSSEEEQPTLSIPSSQFSWNLGYEAQTVEVEFSCNAEWAVSVDDASSSWLSVTPSKGNAGEYTLSISVSENTDKDSRTGTVTVSSRELSKEISFTQSGFETTLSIPSDQLSWDLGYEAQSVEVEFSCNAEWSVSVDDASSAWLSVTPVEGDAGQHTLSISVAENTSGESRTGTVTVSSGEESKEISLTQSGFDMTLDIPSSQLSWNLSYEAQSVEVNLSCNAEWSVSVDDASSAWLSVTPAEGDAGQHTLSISVAENTSGESRTGTVTVSAGEESKEISLTQSGFDTTLDIPSSQLSWSLGYEAQSVEVNLSCNAEWSVSVDAASSSWLSVSPSKGGAGQHTLSVSVSENTKGEPRTGTVTVSAGDVSKVIVFMQSGFETTLSIPSSQLSWNLGYESQSVEVNLGCNAEWSVSVDAASSSWLSVSPSKGGAGQHTLSVSVSENTNGKSRTGTVTVSSGNVSKVIVFTQSGFETTLSIPSSQLSWSLGYESQSVEVNLGCNAEWSVSVDAASSSWLSVSPSKGGAGQHTLSISVSENTGEESRTGIVTVSSGEVSKKISLTQSGRIFQPEIGGPEDMPVEEWK